MTTASTETTAEKLHFNDHLVDGLLEKAIALRPLLEANAQQNEDRGELTPAVIEALTESGLLKMAAPERLGGLAISSRGQAKVMAEVAKGCPSSAWIVTIVNSVIWLGSGMSWDMQRYLFKDDVPILCSPTNGGGSLEPEGDHFVLNGTWAYGSASHHAKWALVPATSPTGALNFVALPLAEATMKNTWKVAGMKGTGSDTLIAEEVKIAADQFSEIPGVGATLSLIDPPAGLTPQGDRPMAVEATDYWVGLTLLRSKMLAVVLGAVEGLFDAVLATQDKGLMFTTYEHRRDSHVFQAGVGEAYAKIAVVRSILEKVMDMNDAAALAGRELTLDERIESRSQVVASIQILIDVTEKLMNLYGTSGYALSSPAQRYWRDFSIGARHAIFSIDVGYEIAGKLLLGIEPNISLPTFL